MVYYGFTEMFLNTKLQGTFTASTYCTRHIYFSTLKYKNVQIHWFCLLKDQICFQPVIMSDLDPPSLTLKNSRSTSFGKTKQLLALRKKDFLKVHKIENFFGSEFEFYTISLLVMLKY
jgi:hypothetical protein